MNTPLDDDKLRALFQAQRQREVGTIPQLSKLLYLTDHGLAVRLRMAFRMALAASIMICVGLTMAVRLWFVGTQLMPTTELAMLSDWTPLTDTLLDITPSSINDATLITEHLLLDDNYNPTHNTEEVL